MMQLSFYVQNIWLLQCIIGALFIQRMKNKYEKVDIIMLKHHLVVSFISNISASNLSQKIWSRSISFGTICKIFEGLLLPWLDYIIWRLGNEVSSSFFLKR